MHIKTRISFMSHIPEEELKVFQAKNQEYLISYNRNGLLPLSTKKYNEIKQNTLNIK